MNKYKSWLLVEIERGLQDLSPDRRSAVLEEVEQHLDSAIQARLELGLSPEEADREAAAHFGSAEAFTSNMLQVTHTPPKKLKKAALIVAAIATTFPLIWALTVENYQWYYVSGLLSAVAPYLFWTLLLVGIAMGGARVRARSFFLIALAGGCLLVPILAARFAASQMTGGIVVRSLALRDQVERNLLFQIDIRDKLRSTLVEFDGLQAQVAQGMPPMAFFQGRMQPVGPISDWMNAYAHDNDSLTGYPTVEDAQAAWANYGASTRAEVARFAGHHTQHVVEIANHLKEPYLYRLMASATYAPVFGLLFGSLLTLSHAIGAGIRWVWDRINRPWQGRARISG